MLLARSADGKQFALMGQRDRIRSHGRLLSLAPQIPLDAQTGDRPLLRLPCLCGVASFQALQAPGPLSPSPDRLILLQSPGPGCSIVRKPERPDLCGRAGRQIRCRRGLERSSEMSRPAWRGSDLFCPPAGFAGAVQFDEGPLLMCRRNRNFPRLEIMPPVPAHRCL